METSSRESKDRCRKSKKEKKLKSSYSKSNSGSKNHRSTSRSRRKHFHSSSRSRSRQCRSRSHSRRYNSSSRSRSRSRYRHRQSRSGSRGHYSSHNSESESKKRKLHGRSRSISKRPRKEKGHREENSSSEDELNPVNFNYEIHKAKLTKIFFREEDMVKQGTSDYKEFWTFLQKYQAMERQRWESDGGKRRKKNKSVPSETLGIPGYCDKSFSLNFKLLPENPKDLLNRIPFQDREGYGSVLTLQMVTEFRIIVSTYINFLQREKFLKIRKLREGQSNLPIAAYRDEILEKLEQNQIIIVAGDTGCGKSTQIPQYLLETGYTNIACTQPRRIACISLASRVAYETLNQHGQEIGYQIRFEKKKTQNTKVVFLTEGLLLRQVTSDHSLESYDVVVLDEVHERHLHGDFLLGIVKCLVQQRKTLKVILMSATINIKLFQEYFHGEAPVIQVPGRLYPIQLQYHAIPSVEDTDRLNPAPYVRVLQMIDKKYPDSERGDLLIFLSGITEITKVVEACRQYAEVNDKWIVLPLHSTLSLAEQDKVFNYPPDGVRKCIVSTNIAETSITIDGVRFVCDSGKVKEMTYDPVCKMQRLKEFWISRASAEQRKGRSGRTGPGVCFRLYSETEYNAFSSYSKPEIQRVPLDSLILQMVSMGLPDCRKFPFIEPPPPESMENSILVLKEQGAMTEDEQLTVIGKMLANLPVDVAVGKMLIMGTMFHQVESVLSLAAALSVQSPFTNKAYRDSDCVASRRNLDSDHGDPVTLLNAFREWLRIKSENSECSRRWCRKRGLEEQRFYEMTKLRKQFSDLLEEAGLLGKGEEDMSGMSSAERMARHGELRQLRDMKRNYHRKEKKKRTLRVGETEEIEDWEEDEVDIKDVDFRLRNDLGKVKKLADSTKAYSYKDLSILKLILTSGLYPQIAIADEFNNYKSGTDQLFHTKVKPFNCLHPNSTFATQPEVLQLDNIDILPIVGFTAKAPASSKHQLLIYLSLLETIKPYLTACLRMPALPSTLLFCHTIDSNADFSRLICDSWLEIKFANSEEGQNQVLRAITLRDQWQELLQLRLAECGREDIEQQSDTKPRQQELERSLSLGLVEFLHTETVFSIKRLLPADIKVAFVGEGCGAVAVEENPFESSGWAVQPHEKKGGVRLTVNLTYNCLVDDAGILADYACVLWQCPMCQLELYCSPLSRMKHLSLCTEEEENKKRKEYLEEQKKNQKASNPLAREFYCDKCCQELKLTSTQILRHKRSCGKDE